MGDEHDAVARADAKERDESDPRTDGGRSPAGKDREHAADKGKGDIGEDESDVAGSTENQGEQEEDAEEGDGKMDDQFALCLLLFFGRAGTAFGPKQVLWMLRGAA